MVRESPQPVQMPAEPPSAFRGWLALVLILIAIDAVIAYLLNFVAN